MKTRIEELRDTAYTLLVGGKVSVYERLSIASQLERQPIHKGDDRMKITIDEYGTKYSVETKGDDPNIDEVLQYIERLLKAVGYNFDGTLEIEPHEYIDREIEEKR